MNKHIKTTLIVLASLTCGIAIDRISHAASESGKVFEIRTYTTPDGKLDDLHKRFREHTMKLFERHGMTNVGYWTPQDAPLASNTLIYVISHKSREDAKKSWTEFSNDPEWRKVKAASEANGPIVTKVESVFVQATDYSPLQ